jgi:CRP-like cAMP-binding protein
MGANVDLPSLLKTIPFFYALTAVQLNRLAEITDYIEIAPNAKLIEEGNSIDFLYILVEGEVTVTVHVPSIGLVETSTFGPLDIIGWSAMTPVVRQRMGTVTASTYCRLLRFDSKQFTQLCENDHDIGFFIYRRISNMAARSFLTTQLRLMNLLAEQL